MATMSATHQLGRRVCLMGSPGSGKSTLGKQLHQTHGLPLFHLDDLYWHPDWVETPDREWQALLEELVRQEAWLIDGNYADTIDLRIQAADTVLFLDTPMITCCWRVVKRTVRNKFGSGEGLPQRIRECSKIRKQKASEGMLKFIKFVIRFHRKVRPNMLKKLRSLQEKQVVILRSKQEIEEFLTSLR